MDQTSEARRSFQLQDYLNEVITSLKPRFKHANTTINVQCEEDILLDSYPGSFAQVITNLMVNSWCTVLKTAAAARSASKPGATIRITSR